MNSPFRLFLPALILTASMFLFSCAATMKPVPEALSGADKTAIDNSISQMPIQTTAAEDLACAAVVAAGKPGVFYLVQKLVPAGTGDDTGVRFALGSVARFVSRAGAAGEKADFVNAALAGIGYHKDVEVKSFLMSQLHYIGGDECVGPVSAYLADPALCEPATQALLAIRTPAAESALLGALPSAAGKNRLTLIRALGDLRCKAAAPAISRFVGSVEPDANMAALWALANIGEHASAPILQNATMNSEGLARKEIDSYNLLFASRIIDDARTVGEAVNQSLLKRGVEGNDDKIIIGALRNLANANGEDANEYLLNAVAGASPVVRKEILNLALSLPGPDISREWLSKMNSSSGEVRNEIMDMLAGRNDASILPALKTALAAREKEDGFVELFNGKDLTGWVSDTLSYAAENGKIIIRPERKGPGNLYTEKEYDNFVLRFEFRLPPNANNGLGIRAPLEGDAAYVGMELQIIDNTGDIYQKLQPYQYHGSVYGVAAARRGFQSPVDEWNCQEIIADGRNIKVTLNGTLILHVNLDQAATPHPLDGREHPGLSRETGHIGFLGHGYRVEFRNIRIKEI